ncbi:hypothetical protein [Lysobacter olei]
MRLFRMLMVCGLLLALVGCASTSQQGDKLDQQQYAWSGAIRWGEVEGATNLIDPKVRDERPVTDLELERWKHIQVTSYRDIGSDRNLEKGVAVREIDIGVMNRHTMAERTVRYRETWRWDAEGKVWWLTSGLPDLWAGQ